MAKNKNPYEKPILRAAAVGVASILIVLGALSPFEGLSFQSESGDSALSVLGRLILISLFVERGIEVFVELWRGAAKNKKKHDIKALNEEKDRIEGNIEEEERLQKNIDELSENLHLYQAITMRISLWMLGDT